MERNRQFLEKEISQIISKTLKQHTSKGPSKIDTYVNKDLITVKFTGFLTEVELSFANDPDSKEILSKLRRSIHKRLIVPAVTGKLKEVLDLLIICCYFDFCPIRNEGVLVFILEE
jgi:uncharacterized protein YbcI